MEKLEDLLKVLLKNRLKISPKKCQLFKTELQYMGNIIFVKDRKVWIKPSTTPKGCRSFAGMVNFLSVFVQSYRNYLNLYMT